MIWMITDGSFIIPGNKSTSDLMIVALKEICFYDPSIAEAADIPPGWKAVRAGVGQPWVKEENT